MTAIDTFAGTFHINITTVSRVVGVVEFTSGLVIGTITDCSLLTATEDLEGISRIEVDGGRAPDL